MRTMHLRPCTQCPVQSIDTPLGWSLNMNTKTRSERSRSLTSFFFLPFFTRIPATLFSKVPLDGFFSSLTSFASPAARPEMTSGFSAVRGELRQTKKFVYCIKNRTRSSTLTIFSRVSVKLATSSAARRAR